MIIHITPEELLPEFQTPWIRGLLSSISIDYATNAIHGHLRQKMDDFDSEEVIIFKFKDYGWINDNKYNTYRISWGEAGITIQINKTI